MLLHKTDKARKELRPGTRTLGQRERTVLLLADGSRALSDFRPLFDGEGLRIARSLLDLGYLEEISGLSRAVASGQTDAGPYLALAPAPAPAPAPPQEGRGADSFDGKRSLATTRMFLFDLCERLFARRDPVRADQIREALRNAKDRESMLAAAREMVMDIERIAGPERADSISERIAMLLPPESVT